MNMVVEGIYEKGIIKLNRPIKAADNSKVLVFFTEKPDKQTFLKAAGSWKEINANVFDDILQSRKRGNDMANDNLSSVSKTDSLNKMGEFWDTHDFTDLDDAAAPDVSFDISYNVRLEEELFHRMETLAKLRGVTIETLANLWLQQKVTEYLHSHANQQKA